MHGVYLRERVLVTVYENALEAATFAAEVNRLLGVELCTVRFIGQVHADQLDLAAA